MADKAKRVDIGGQAVLEGVMMRSPEYVALAVRRPDGSIVVNPLLPKDTWDYFCLDGISYHGHILTIIYDKDGQRYHQGKGLTVLVDGVPSQTLPEGRE